MSGPLSLSQIYRKQKLYDQVDIFYWMKRLRELVDNIILR